MIHACHFVCLRYKSRANLGVQQDEPRIYVESEDQPERMLLETKIVKDDGYQKQQGQQLNAGAD